VHVGEMSLTDIVVPAHTVGPPLHTHDFDEAFYMLEGELIFMAAEAEGVEPPEWALKPIPEITIVGPPIDAEA